MSPRAKFFFALALAIGAVGLFFGAREISTLREELAALRRNTTQFEAEAKIMRQDSDEAVNRLQQSETDLGALEADASKKEASEASPREVEIKAWISRVKQLKLLLEQRPDQRIPELALLTELDWLHVGKSAQLDSEEKIRKALAQLRSTAKEGFARKLGQAVVKFTKASNGELPTSTLDLAPFVDPPVDAAMLQRYQMKQTGKVRPERGGIPTIQEIAPIDPIYDSRTQVGSGGGFGSTSGPTVWMDAAAVQRAYGRYSDARKAPPKSIGEVIPFFDPPLTPAQIEMMLDYEKAHPR